MENIEEGWHWIVFFTTALISVIIVLYRIGRENVKKDNERNQK